MLESKTNTNDSTNNADDLMTIVLGHRSKGGADIQMLANCAHAVTQIDPIIEI